MNTTRTTFQSLFFVGAILFLGHAWLLAAESDTSKSGSTPYVTTDTFDEEVIQADVPVLVDFTATWCVPCREVDPIIDELSTEMKDAVKIFKLDIDESPEVYQKYQVNGIPHILFFREGLEEDRIGGAQPKSVYVGYLDGMIAGKSAADVTIEMLAGDQFRRYFILGRDLEIVRSAVEKIPDLLTKEFENGQTPLSLVLNRPSVRQNELIELTLSFEPDITPHDLVGLGRCEEFLAAVENDPSLINQPDPDGNTVLVTAMMRSNRLGDKDCTATVLDSGVDLTKQNSSSFSLGRAIALQQDSDLLKKFLALGWDADLQDEQGRSTLQWAAYYGYVDSVLILLEEGADSTLEDPDGRTLLDYVQNTYARAKQSLEAMNASGDQDFADRISTVRASIKSHEQVLDLLKTRSQSVVSPEKSDAEI